jgi:hypothetical protein
MDWPNLSLLEAELAEALSLLGPGLYRLIFFGACQWKLILFESEGRNLLSCRS